MIPFQYPQVQLSYRIAIIGSEPRKEDVVAGAPFSGGLGNMLASLLHRADIQKSACLLGYACQEYGNFSDNSYQKLNSLEELEYAIRDYNPTIVVLLGAYATRICNLRPTYPSARGGLFVATAGPLLGRKCISSYSLLDAFKYAEALPLLGFDLKRAREEGESSELELPQREFLIGLKAHEVVARLDSMTGSIAFDIEGGGASPISMISIATSPLEVLHIMPTEYTVGEWRQVLLSLKLLLENPNVEKVLQNALYDITCLARQWGIVTRNVARDTMIGGWELYPELKKALGVQASIYTKEFPYKADRKTDDIRIFKEYNCKDSAVTFEIDQKHKLLMNEEEKDHCEFAVDLIPPTLFMVLKGWNYNKEKADEKRKEIVSEQNELLAMIETLAETPLNPNSPKQMIEVIYGKCRFEKQYAKAVSGTRSLTCDVTALLKLLKETRHPLISAILKWRALDGVRKQLLVKPSKDGRIHCSYNIVGTVTGRYSCSAMPDGTGTNLQTITYKNRELYCADPGYELFQCDLEGADGWTVAAWGAYYGYANMLEDYQHSPIVKPAKTIAAMYLAPEAGLSNFSSEQMFEYLKGVKLPDWLYAASKMVQHGTNYGLQPKTMSSNFLLRSYKETGSPIYISPDDCRILQEHYLSRYPGVRAWQDMVKRTITGTRKLRCASGHTRKFFGNPNAHNVLMEALSQEPQANTTHATNLVLWKLWHHVNNRKPDGRLIIEPLHQMHDAVIGQWRIEDREKAFEILKEAFHNELRIGEQTIVIPTDGKYGQNWGNLANEFSLAKA